MIVAALVPMILCAGMAFGQTAKLDDLFNKLKAADPLAIDWVGTSMGGLIGLGFSTLPPQVSGATLRRFVLNDVGPVLEWRALQRSGAAAHPGRSRQIVHRHPEFFDGTFMDCVYFSFTTYTTIGFGDMPHDRKSAVHKHALRFAVVTLERGKTTGRFKRRTQTAVKPMTY